MRKPVIADDSLSVALSASQSDLLPDINTGLHEHFGSGVRIRNRWSVRYADRSCHYHQHTESGQPCDRYLLPSRFVFRIVLVNSHGDLPVSLSQIFWNLLAVMRLDCSANRFDELMSL